MSRHIKTDLCVIGGGSGGLSVAAAAAQMGAKVVLAEKGKMGGDCLNYGCVPSKALIAAAQTVATARAAARFGVAAEGPVDMAAVRDHVRGVIAAIAPHDSVERFEGLGVTVVQGAARFTGPREVTAGGHRIAARRFVVATGSAPAIPPIAGIDAVPVLTNETVFDLDAVPEHLVVIGGGPIGAELAQAHRRLGADVTVVEAANLLGRDDPQAASVVRDRFRREGIRVLEGAAVERVARHDRGVAVHLAGGDVVVGSHLLVAAGRRPNVAGLDLEAAGIACSDKGIDVDRRLRTSNRRVFAIGDVTGRHPFTHAAAYHAGIVIRNVLFRLPAKVRDDAMPWVTYTDPELAQVGLTEAAARGRDLDVSVVSWPFAENDRARAEGATDGFVKAVIDGGGRVVGATVVGARAGELIGMWALAVSRRLKVGALASVVLPYPTLSEAGKRAAGQHFTGALFSDRTRSAVRLIQEWT